MTDETLWTDPDDPTLIPYRKAKTLAEKAAWDFMAGYDGPMTLATILPGAVFGPILTTNTLGSVGIVARMMQGRMPGTPRIGLEVVDVRDLADVHIEAMVSPAAGQRFLTTGEFIWMRDMARALPVESRPGRASDRDPTTARLRRPFLGAIPRSFIADDHPRLSAAATGTAPEKARGLLGWQRRPAAEVVVECARSLIERKAV